VQLPGVARGEQPDPGHRDEPRIFAEQILDHRGGRVVILFTLGPHHIWRTPGRKDHRGERGPAFTSAGQTLLARVGDGPGDRLVGMSLAVGVVHKCAQWRGAAGRAPRAALLPAHVEEVRVDRDRRLSHPLPRLQWRVGLRCLQQALAGTGAGVVLAARLITLVGVDQQVRLKPLRRVLDDHQVAAVVHLVPTTTAVEQRRGMPGPEVVHQV